MPASTCHWPVLGASRVGAALAARQRRRTITARALGGGGDGGDDAPLLPPAAVTTAVEPERRASRSRHAELLDRELAAVRAMALDEAGLRAALRALGDDDGAEEEDGDAPASAPNNNAAALQRRLAARRLRERARVVRLPLRHTSSGKRAAARRYMTVPVDVDGVGFTDFLLDAGVYGAAITPSLRERLGLAPTDGAAVTALASGGATVRQRVQLPDLWIGTAKLPPLQATVGPLPSAALATTSGAADATTQQQQQQQRPPSPLAAARARQQQQQEQQQQDQHNQQQAAEPPGGLLGVKALRAFDVDVDPRRGALGLHPAGHAAAGLLDVSGLRPVACRFTRAGLVCLPVALGLAGGGGGGAPALAPPPPPAVLGILDLSATVSVLNWQAASLLGMACEAAVRERDEDEAEGGEEEEEEEEEEAEAGRAAASPPPLGAPRRRPPRARRPLDYRGHYGQIVFSPAAADPRAPPALLARPIPPPAPPAAQPPPGQTPPPRRRAASPGGGGGGGVRATRLALQEHRVAAPGARLVLGDPRVGGGRVELSPLPSRVAVAHLRGLAQLGLGEQPAMLVGQDVWGARGGRAVLCLKEGLLYLEE
jgi:hypothetical protein